MTLYDIYDMSDKKEFFKPAWVAGGSLVITIPADVVQSLNIVEGEYLKVIVGKTKSEAQP
jgi:hypothetical protein